MNKITIKEKINAWIADYEDSSLLEESIGAKNVKNYLLNDAKEILDIIKERQNENNNTK